MRCLRVVWEAAWAQQTNALLRLQNPDDYHQKSQDDFLDTCGFPRAEMQNHAPSLSNLGVVFPAQSQVG